MTAVVQKIETPEPLASCFAALGIPAQSWGHPPVFTVAEGEEFKKQIPGGHTKNLFLKDKKGQLWLITALWDTVIDLKGLPDKIGCDRVSFGSPARLLEALGVAPGSVTPLALLNDTARKVRPVLDARLMACETVNCHPLKNDKTTTLTPQDLVKFLENMGYNPRIIDFGPMAPI